MCQLHCIVALHGAHVPCTADADLPCSHCWRLGRGCELHACKATCAHEHHVALMLKALPLVEEERQSETLLHCAS